MNSINISAILLTFIIYILLAIAYYGWGRSTTKFLFRDQKSTYLTTNIWVGWALSLLIFQVIHLLLPLDIFAVLPVFIIGIVLAFLYIFKRKKSFNKIFFNIPGKILLLIAIPVILWIASHSMLAPYNYDSGLYHLNIIKWTNSYSIVPGLGNLHGRFAFNQSFFTYVAALNFFPYFNHGRSLANSFLIILSFATVIELLWPMVKQPSIMEKTHPFKYVPSFFIFPVLIYLALSSNALASPSPDLTSTLLQLLMFIFLAKSIGEWIEDDVKQNNNAIFLAILAATAITIKLSNLAFSAIIFTIILIYLINTKQLKSRTTLYIMMLSAIIIFILMLRGVILSGVPLYPSTIGYGLIPVEWLMLKEKIINEANWVYSWARQPRTHWSEVLGNWNWFKPWFDNILKHRFIEVIYPLLIAISFLSITFMLIVFKKIKKPQLAEALVILPAIASLLFWFFTAPSLRFANALMFLLFLSSFMLFFTSIRKYVNTKILFSILGLVFLFGNINLFMYVYEHPKCLTKLSAQGWHAPKKVPLVKKVTKTGLEIYTPQKGDQCWDSELPCTPYFNGLLKLRVDGDIASGFMMSKKPHQEKK